MLNFHEFPMFLSFLPRNFNPHFSLLQTNIQIPFHSVFSKCFPLVFPLFPSIFFQGAVGRSGRPPRARRRQRRPRRRARAPCCRGSPGAWILLLSVIGNYLVLHPT